MKKSLKIMSVFMSAMLTLGSLGAVSLTAGAHRKGGKLKMKRFRVMAAALCAVVLLCGFSVPAYAYADGGEGADYCDPTMTEEAPAPD